MSTADQEFEIPDGLENRCQRVYGWDAVDATVALGAYRDFMKLKRQLEDWDAKLLSPSLMIDKVWHQHILEVGHYVKACRQYTGGHLIDHDPDGGLDVEARKARIRSTKMCYKAMFGRNTEGVRGWAFDFNAETDEEEVRPGKKRKTSTDKVNVEFYFYERGSRYELSLDIKETTKFEDAFSEFSAHSGIPVSDMHCFYGNLFVTDSDTPDSIEPCSIKRQEMTLTLQVTRRPAPSNKPPITIRIRDQTGEERFFKLTNSTPVGKIFRAYAERKGASCNSLHFLLDGERLDASETPNTVGLDDQDQIDCIIKQSGC